MSQPDTVKVELEIPSKTVTALLKIAFHFAMDSNKLAVFLLEWQLACETDHCFANLVDDKVDEFLIGNCWDHETLKHLQGEVKETTREKP